MLLGHVRRLNTIRPEKVETLKTKPEFRKRLQGLWQDLFGSGKRKHISEKKFEFDGLPRNYVKIYDNQNRRYLLICYGIMAVAMPFTMIHSVYMYVYPEAMMTNLERDRRLGRKTMGTPEQLRLFVLLAGILLVVLTAGVVKMYRAGLLRIYLNRTNGLYTGIYRDYFMRLSRLNFSNKDTAIYEKRGYVTGQMFGNITIKGRRYVILECDFINGAAFAEMMRMSEGEEKPGKRKIIKWKKYV